FFFSSRRRHTRFSRDWSSDVCSSDLSSDGGEAGPGITEPDVHQWFFQEAETFIVRRIDFRITVLHRPAFTTVRGMQNQRVVAHRDRKSVVEGKRGELGERGTAKMIQG